MSNPDRHYPSIHLLSLVTNEHGLDNHELVASSFAACRGAAPDCGAEACLLARDPALRCRTGSFATVGAIHSGDVDGRRSSSARTSMS